MNAASPTPETKTPREYFVDEAGDDTLFNSRGKVIIGEEGCSRFFLLGVLALPDADAVTRELAELRVRLLADPYFKKVPSISLVHDVDDTRWRQYGEYYDKRRPLNKAALRERPGI
jgi:hypothetical protein